MFPDLFSIGPFLLHTYGLFVGMGFFVGLLVTLRIGKSEGIPAQKILDMGFLMFFSALIGSRLMYVFMNPSYYRHHPLDILKVWQGGLVFSGGVIAVVLIMIWYARRHAMSLWKVGDLWAPAAAIGQCIGRIGCFMAGCCYGKPADGSWGVTFTHPHSLAPLGVPLHPTQLYAAVGGLTVFVILLLLAKRKQFQGQVFLWFLILHSTARLAVERFRGDDRGMVPGTEMSITQLVSMGILIAAVVALTVMKSRSRKRSPSP